MRALNWDGAISAFLTHAAAEKGLARNSLQAYAQDLAGLRRWAEQEKITGPERLRDGDLHFALADDVNAFLDWLESRDAKDAAHAAEKADPDAGDPTEETEEPAGIATS